MEGSYHLHLSIFEILVEIVHLGLLKCTVFHYPKLHFSKLNFKEE